MNNGKVTGFLHADGRIMRNGNGEEVILNGWGAGNWMNPEGYMVWGAKLGLGGFNKLTDSKLALNGRGDRGRTMHQVIVELCGTEYAKSFWPRWYRNHLSEGDIAEMARWGYNSIRLPLDAGALLYEEPGITFNEDSFAVLDELLDLCEKYGLYVLLDMHGTPGHSGVDCDNGIDNVPRIFLEDETFERMVTLWVEIARRYQDRWIVGAYELLNEPLFPAWLHLKDRLVAFYDEIIKRIRVFDKKHMFLLSGPQVGTDQSIFTRSFDPECENWAYTFHGYHMVPEQPSFQKNLETSYRLNVPCIHGEGREAIRWMPIHYAMLAEQHVGWNLFCWKSEGVSGMENGPVWHRVPEGWEPVMSYITEGGPRPSYAESQRLFDALLDCVRFENCQVKSDMFRYSKRKQGIIVPGAGYDSRGGEGVSFSGGWQYGNPLNYRLADHTKLVLRQGVQVPSSMSFAPGNRTNPTEDLYLELNAGEFACYSVNDVTTDCPVVLGASVLAEAVLDVNGTEVRLPQGEQEMVCLTLQPAEKHTVRIAAKEGTVQIKSVAFQ